MIRGIAIQGKLPVGIAFCLLFAGAPRTVSATPLLLGAVESQIETWLGGNYAFTNLYTKTTGDTSATFHGAVDLRGPTVTLMEATVFAAAESSAVFGQTFLIGGYNPLSWDAGIGGPQVVNSDAQRTAFIYNVTTNQMQNERLGPSIGNLQTFNNSIFGPTFGGGHDLFVDSNLLIGYSLQHTYGSPGSCSTYGGQNIFGIADANCNTPHQTTQFNIGALEVYSLEPDAQGGGGAVPEPASLVLLGTGVALLVHRRLRRRRAA